MIDTILTLLILVALLFIWGQLARIAEHLGGLYGIARDRNGGPPIT